MKIKFLELSHLNEASFISVNTSENNLYLWDLFFFAFASLGQQVSLKMGQKSKQDPADGRKKQTSRIENILVVVIKEVNAVITLLPDSKSSGRSVMFCDVTAVSESSQLEKKRLRPSKKHNVLLQVICIPS